MNKELPQWNTLRNEIGTRFNDFCIIRGEQYIKMGEDVWVGYFCLIDASAGLEIGNHVSISSGVHIYTHDTSNFRISGGVKDIQNGSHVDRAPVKIGSNVQIGANSTILKGVEIGNNVIIGAMSLVNKDIPNNCTAFGVPVKIKGEEYEY